MKQLKEYLITKNEGFEFLNEGNDPANAKKAALLGPIHELQVGRDLNNGNFPEDYRVEGKRPEDIHHEYSKGVFGAKYKSHKGHASTIGAGKGGSDAVKKFLKVKSFDRVAWTSQPSDHEKETNVDDPNSKADLIVTLPKSSKGGDHKRGKKVAISIKYKDEGEKRKKGPTNWSNNGKKTLETFSGADLDVPQKTEHRALLKKHGIKNRADYRIVRDKNPKAIDEINESHANMSAEVAQRFADGLRNKYHHKSANTQDENLKTFIKRSVGAVGNMEGGNPETGHTHLHHIILKTTRKKDGTYSHEVNDIPSYVHNYLTHFKDLSVEYSPGQKGVKIMGSHKGTGKRMEVHRTQIYGDQSTTAWRTSTTLGSEGHKTIDHNKEFKELKEEFNYLQEKKSNQEKIMAAAQRAQAVFNTLQNSKIVTQKRMSSDSEAEQKSQIRSAITRQRDAAAAQRQARAADVDTATYWRDEEGNIRGVGGSRFASTMAKQANLERPNNFKLEEEAPANAMGTAGISGAETAVDAGIAGYDLPIGMVRRQAPKMFGGKRVFTVPSKDYYKATLGRRKGQHWRSMVNGPLGEEIRQYALENKEAPIIVEDETTGAMMYLRYGKR